MGLLPLFTKLFHFVGFALNDTICFPFRFNKPTVVDQLRLTMHYTRREEVCTKLQTTTKGQLISKGNFGVLKSTKKPTNFFSTLLP